MLQCDMDQRLNEIAKAGDIEALYSLIKQDPFILEKTDHLLFAETPLHVAILSKKPRFMKEIAILKPSFVNKLNESGYSPLHIASMEGQEEMVKELLKINPKLCFSKGKDDRTPLHCAAMTGNTNVVKILLDCCPKALFEVTIKKETALHMAVKAHRLEAFQSMLGWLKTVYDIEVGAIALLFAVEGVNLESLLSVTRLLDKNEFEVIWFSFVLNNNGMEDYAIISDRLKKIKREEVLNWKDDEGNTVLHLATFNRQCQMIEALLSSCTTESGPRVEVNAMNANNLTALDILLQLPREEFNEEIECILHRAGAVIATQISTASLSPPARISPEKSLELRGRPAPNLFHVTLIGAMLIATVCFLISVNLSGGAWRNKHKPYNTTATGPQAITTKVIIWLLLFPTSMILSSYTFFVSLSIIALLTKGSPLRWLFLILVAALSGTYLFAIAFISADENTPSMFDLLKSQLAILIFPLAVEAFLELGKCKRSSTKGD